MGFNGFIGLAMLAFGCFSLYATFAKPDFFKKREAMKAQWGKKTGSAIHFGAYVILPILAGLAFLAGEFI